jgi:Ca2+-binding EF-hand superfamily protein
MALQQIMQEQQALRGQLQSLESMFFKEVQQITARIEANEKRIASLGGAPGPMQSRQAPPPPVLSNNAGGGGYPTYGAPQPPQAPAARSGRESEQARMSAQRAAENSKKEHDIWVEPQEHKVASSQIDRFEGQLRSAFERKMDKRWSNNPPQAMQMLFQRLDKNHSGKVSVDELQNMCKYLEFQVDGKSLTALFNRYDLDHSGTLSLTDFCRSLFKSDGDKEFKAKSAIAKMREVLAERAGGFETMKTMGIQFRIIDRDRTGQLTKDEFEVALNTLFTAFKVKFTPAEKNALFLMFDHDKSGSLDYDEFIRGIRGDMSDFRLDWVKQAFTILDKDRSGTVDLNDIDALYDVAQNPNVITGRVSPNDAFNKFIAHWDQNADGKITMEEFIENYQWISASISSDDYFELMMRNAWHISGGEGWCENTSDLRVLVKHSNGAEEVVEVKHDMGLPADPSQKYQEIVKRLTQQGVKDIAKIEMYG